MSEVVIVPDPDAAGELVADLIAAEVRRRPVFVLGVATGASPRPVYRALTDRVAGGLDVSQLRCFALDEYVGLPPGHPESFREVLLREAIGPWGLDPSRLHSPDGSLDGLATAGERYEQEIADAGGIDLQLVGIGLDGHIAFNEPSSSLASSTRVKTLTERTRAASAPSFGSVDAVPRRCITQGVGTILRSRHVVLLAFGTAKAAAVAAAVEGPVTSNLPASAIQLHPRATVVVDEPAAAMLTHVEYYRDAWANRL